MPKSPTGELPIVQKTYDLIKWYVPILNRLPRNHKFGLGDRMVTALYDLLEGFVAARYASDKLAILQPLSGTLPRSGCASCPMQHYCTHF